MALLFLTIKFSFSHLPLPMNPSSSHFQKLPSQLFGKNGLLGKQGNLTKMDIELMKCECCGLKEDCTQDYIAEVKANFEGKWLCGLCSEAVRDEVNRGKKQSGLDEAVKAHMSFCRKYKSNPAVRVADGMRQMLRRRSGDNPPSPTSKKYSRSASTSQVGDESRFSYS